MLNSVEYEMINAHTYKNIKKYSFFSDSDKPRMLFVVIVGILKFMSRKIFMLNSIEHGKGFITSRPDN